MRLNKIFVFILPNEITSSLDSIQSAHVSKLVVQYLAIYTAMKNEWVSDSKQLFLPKVQYNLLWAFPYIALSVERYIILDVLLQCTLY